MKQQEKTTRNSLIVAAFLEATHSMAELGRIYGITRERVRQIVVRELSSRYPPESVPTLMRNVRKLHTERTRITLTCPQCGDSFKERPNACRRRTYCSRACAREGAKTPILQRVRQLRAVAARLGHTPTTAEMHAYLPGGATTYVRVFGGIAEAQRAAGLTPNKRGGWRRAKERPEETGAGEVAGNGKAEND